MPEDVSMYCSKFWAGSLDAQHILRSVCGEWHGQYITRPAKLIDQSIYQSMAKSGAEGLTIGVESGSDAVRDHMKKKFLSVDLDHEMEQFSKHGLDTVLLFFSSYPTETWDDFVDTCQCGFDTKNMRPIAQCTK